MIRGDKVSDRLCLEPEKELGNERQLVCFHARRTVEEILEIEIERLRFDELLAELLDQVQILDALLEAHTLLQAYVREVYVGVACVEYNQSGEECAVGQ
jgi:hypothetical protein